MERKGKKKWLTIVKSWHNLMLDEILREKRGIKLKVGMNLLIKDNNKRSLWKKRKNY